jgi:U3 small nucleolar RNA-associated protein 7
MKKYQYAQPHMLKAHSKPPKRAKSAFDKKLGHHLAHLSSSAQASASLSASHDDLLLQHNNAGALEAETDLERTWRVTQDEIVEASAVSAESQAFNLQLDQFGPYDLSYTRNGR